jgi:hypothetical protein
VLAAIGLLSHEDTPAPAPPPKVKLVEIGTFDQPVHVTSPPGDKRLFVVEKTGRIQVLVKGLKLARPFLDLSKRVSVRGIEEGLLSVAFAPDYETSGRFYVDYTDRRHRTIVEEYTRSADPNRADPESARRLLLISNPTLAHHAGLLLFGPDGMLYVSQGDGGNSSKTNFPAQGLDTLHGKILRIDPLPRGTRPFGVPNDNPFVGRPGRDEIWVYGLRNPWRFAFEPRTGAMVIGDAGQLSVEEIDVATRSGLNFGWSCFEGTAPFFPDGVASCASSVPPIVEHLRGATPVVPRPETAPPVTRGRPRVDTRLRPGGPACSVVVGVFVRDPELPSLAGRHVYGDFCETMVRSFRLENGRAVDRQELGVTVFVMSSFGTDAAGHVYVTSLAGPVFRLAPL